MTYFLFILTVALTVWLAYLLKNLNTLEEQIRFKDEQIELRGKSLNSLADSRDIWMSTAKKSQEEVSKLRKQIFKAQETLSFEGKP